MKKIAIFTNHYYPENFKINELVEVFKEELDINLITQIPNYPLGSFYDGYSYRKNRTYESKNLNVHRLAVIPRKKNAMMLSLNYVSNATAMYLYGSFNREPVDHVYAYVTSPIFISWGALKLAKRNKVKSTLYLLDLWPASLIGALNIKNKWIIKWLNRISINIYKAFDNIVVSSNDFIEELVEFGIDESKITYIPQHANEILEEPIKIMPATERLEIVFAGNVGQAQNLDILVDAIEILKSESILDVHVTIVGDGRARKAIEDMIDKKDVREYFTFTGRVAGHEVKQYLENKHFGYVSLVDISPINKTIPAKIQSYMGYGLPILSCAPGSVNTLIDQVACGISCDEPSGMELANLIKSARNYSYADLSAMANQGIQYSKDNFDIIEISKRFIEIMKEGN